MRTELVTTLKRKATDLISDITTAHEPIMITQPGVPAAYLVDVHSYQQMELRVKLLEGIALGEKAISEGRIVQHSEAKDRMSRWLK